MFVIERLEKDGDQKSTANNFSKKIRQLIQVL